MRTALALRRDDVWVRHVTRMVGLSTAVHAGLFLAVAMLGVWAASRRPEPIVAYSVELTDFPGTGGRLPSGPGNGLIGRSAPAAGKAAALKAPPPPPAAPKAAEAPPPPPPPPPAKPAEVAPKPVAKVAPKVEPKKVEPKKAAPKAEVKKPEPKPEPKKVEAKKLEPPKPAPAEAKPAAEPAKPEAKAATETPPAATPPATTPPSAAAKPAAAPTAGAQAAAKPGAAADDYASAAQRFRDRMAAVGTGGGVAGEGTAGGGPGGGVLGSGGDGRGGGQLKSLEWVAYRQRVINTVKERWSNAIKRPGLLTTVRFRIAPDGTVSGAVVVRSSGNVVYDQTAVAAVERVRQLPPPPPAYVKEFGQFEINFHGDETGGVS